MIKTANVISDESADDEVGLNNKVELYLRMMTKRRPLRL